MELETITVGSFGGGVQTSALALMAEEGLIEKPEFWGMGDTEDETRATYAWIEFLRPMLTVPLIVVRRGNLAHDAIYAKRRPTLPYWQPPSQEARALGKKDAKVKRTCTDLYKLEPLYKYIRRERFGYQPRQRFKLKRHHVRMIIGISCDEASRMKPPREKWSTNVYPLIDMWKSRQWCEDYVFARTGKKPPRSACVVCPFRNDVERLTLEPDELQRAIEFDRRIRSLPGYKQQPFLHRSLKPLGEVDLHASAKTNQLNLFENQCGRGFCGT